MVSKTGWVAGITMAVGVPAILAALAAGQWGTGAHRQAQPPGTAAPLAVTAPGLAAVDAARPPSQKAAYGVRDVRLTAGRNYYHPVSVVVNQGEEVRLELNSRDVIHRFVMPDYGINVVISANSREVVSFVASSPGESEFRWSEYYNANRPDMVGRFYVVAVP